MAEIRIKKKRSPVLGWLLALLIVLAGAFAVYKFVLQDDDTSDQPVSVDNRNNPNPY